ncbi:MAG: hypothetical protein ABXS91_10765 [Sulfurimonas sp.]
MAHKPIAEHDDIDLYKTGHTVWKPYKTPQAFEPGYEKRVGVDWDDGDTAWVLPDIKKAKNDEPECIEYANGTRRWRLNGRLHREDGPAVIRPDGTREWWLDGRRHRKDGPAVEYSDDHGAWYLNDKLHREDGPAIETPQGDRMWWLNGRLHREDGPAIEWSDGTREWWLDGKRVTQEEVVRMPDGTSEHTLEDRDSEYLIETRRIIWNTSNGNRLEIGPSMEDSNSIEIQSFGPNGQAGGKVMFTRELKDVIMRAIKEV